MKGAGKSTLAHLLSNKGLQAILNDRTGKIVIDAKYPVSNIIIGHRMASETTIPNKILADFVIWDSPGSEDTDPIQEIVNRFYIKRLIEITDLLKFILVVPDHILQIIEVTCFLKHFQTL